ncbi:MAG: ATP-binding protein [Verrucomicrobiota bacterium]
MNSDFEANRSTLLGPGLACCFDAHGVILDASSSFEERLGILWRSNESRNFGSLLSGERGNDFNPEALIAEGEISRPIHGFRGDPIWFRWVFDKIDLNEEEVFRAVGVDVTDFALHETAQNERENIYRVVVDSQPQYVCQFLPSGRIIFSNPSFSTFAASLFGLGGELLGSSFFDLLPAEAVSEARERLTEIGLEDGKWKRDLHYAGDKGLQSVIWEFRPVHDELGVLLFFLGIGNNCTDERKIKAQLCHAKEEAESMNRAKSSFLANISHELRTPLNSILGFSAVLEKSIEDPKLLGYVESIQSSGESLLSVLNAVLNLAKSDSETLRIETEDVELEGFLAEVASGIDEDCRAKGLGFDLDLASSLPNKLRFDPTVLMNALGPLGDNAVKYTKSGGVKIVVWSESGGSTQGCVDLCIDVADTGYGVPDEFREHVFEPFFQVKSSNHREFGGAGLGLAVCRRFVEAMDGRVELRPNEGGGTVASLRIESLPVIDEIPAGDSLNQDCSLAEMPPMRVLVADDSKLNRILIGSFFGKSDHEVIQAVDGDEALEQIRIRKPDIAVLDVCMPGKTGTEVAREVRESADFGEMPIVFVTASSRLEKERFEDLRELGDAIITKPVTESDLASALNSIAGLRVEAADFGGSNDGAFDGNLRDIFENLKPEVEWREGLDSLPFMDSADWAKFRSRLDIDELETFSKAFVLLSQRINNLVLMDWASDLHRKVLAVDVAEIELLLDEIAGLKAI